MASKSCLAFKRLLSSTVVPRSLRPTAAYRLFITKSGFYDPITPAMSLNHVVRPLKDEGPLVVATAGRLGWVVTEKGNALHVRIDMPGLSREDVKLSLKQDTLVIKGENQEEGEGRKYSSRIELPEEEYKADEIKVEMKNGVLKVVVPKIIQRDRNDALHIQVD
ncbi:Alpha crystallin/Hsp20 domain-containing protein [Hirschfeldia incana]|nr:Alpha crystallin/Hsp20 domain-containing protein [Hirschfeldia incana]